MTRSRQEELEKAERKRLEKLSDEWKKPPDSRSREKLSAGDLRLLLEHFSPFRQLIREIVGAPGPACEELPTGRLRALSNTEYEVGQAPNEAELAPVLARELDQTKAKCNELTSVLEECMDATRKLKLNNEELRQGRRRLEDELKQAKREIQAARQELARVSRAEVDLLRADGELARFLDLADLPVDEIEALVQVVAVLAQRDNLQRLWGVLKERCEEQNRPAFDAELSLLQSALSWHNHNWRKRPFRLAVVPKGQTYDYERQLRSRHTATGDTVRELRLPGIADGSGKLLCKPLVGTG